MLLSKIVCRAFAEFPIEDYALDRFLRGSVKLKLLQTVCKRRPQNKSLDDLAPSWPKVEQRHVFTNPHHIAE